MSRLHHRRTARTQRKAVAGGGNDALTRVQQVTSTMQVLFAQHQWRHVTVFRGGGRQGLKGKQVISWQPPR